MLSFTAVHLDDYRFCVANTISRRYLSLNAPAVQTMPTRRVLPCRPCENNNIDPTKHQKGWRTGWQKGPASGSMLSATGRSQSLRRDASGSIMAVSGHMSRADDGGTAGRARQATKHHGVIDADAESRRFTNRITIRGFACWTVCY